MRLRGTPASSSSAKEAAAMPNETSGLGQMNARVDATKTNASLTRGSRQYSQVLRRT